MTSAKNNDSTVASTTAATKHYQAGKNIKEFKAKTPIYHNSTSNVVLTLNLSVLGHVLIIVGSSKSTEGINYLQVEASLSEWNPDAEQRHQSSQKERNTVHITCMCTVHNGSCNASAPESIILTHRAHE